VGQGGQVALQNHRSHLHHHIHLRHLCHRDHRDHHDLEGLEALEYLVLQLELVHQEAYVEKIEADLN
jgi:hypothetical protein